MHSIIASEELFRIIFGPYGLSYVDPPLIGQFELFSGLRLKYSETLVILLSVAVLSVLAWLSLRTRIGVAWRATVTDPEMARAFGISAQNVRYLNFFIGSALAAVAGVLVALLNNLVEPTMGAVASYKALVIIVPGGLGNIRGTLLASMLLGIIESFGNIHIGHLIDRDALAFAFLIIILMVRPQGLMGVC